MNMYNQDYNEGQNQFANVVNEELARNQKGYNYKKDRKGIAGSIARTICIAVIFGLVAGVIFRTTSGITTAENKKAVILDNESATKLQKSKGKLNKTATSTATTVNDVSDVVGNVMPAVVQVTNMSVREYRSFFGTYEKPQKSAGSGIIPSQDDTFLYIATNNHVVENSTSLTVTFVDDKAVEASIVGTDPQTDLALIKVSVAAIDSSTMNKIKVATLGSSDNLSVGESAIVIGNALGYGQSVTTGVISAKGRSVTTRSANGESYTNKLIQTDAAVNPGNSGGALLNMNGEVVGIVSAKYSDTEVEGMGYAIPISSASSIIQQLIEGKPVEHQNTDIQMD
jgi:serine protease Do